MAYESRGGRTALAARLVADGLRSTGAVVGSVPLAQVGIAELAATDLLVVGTWVEGFLVAGVRPASATRAWLAGLPRLDGLRTAAFCTFAVAPRGALATMSQALEDRGAVVLSEGAFGRGDIAADVERFTGQLRTAAWPGRNQAARRLIAARTAGQP